MKAEDAATFDDRAANESGVDDPRKSFLPWWEPVLGEAEAAAVAAVAASGWVNEGRLAIELAARVARTLGARYGTTTTSGTTALFVALRAAGVRPGDEVIVPDLTFVATASAVRLCGARPVIADVLPADLTLDPDQVASVLTDRTVAILPVHLNGRPADVGLLRKVAASAARPVSIIEDACQALGSRVDGSALGTMADAGCFSLAPTKLVTAGQGGLILTNDGEMAERFARLKDHGRSDRAMNAHPEPGFNFKLTDLQAAVALAQLDRLAARINQVVAQYTRYRDGLADVPGLTCYSTRLDRGVVPLWVDIRAEHRDRLVEALALADIEARPFWPALHTQGPDRSDRAFPVATDAAEHGLWLPSGPARTEADIDRVIETVGRACRRLHGGAWS